MFSITEFIKRLSACLSQSIPIEKSKKTKFENNNKYPCELWLIEGSFDYSERKIHNHDNHHCVFLRVRHKGEWYNVNVNGLPVGRPHTDTTISEWKFIKKIDV